jgi:hypothetical protein
MNMKGFFFFLKNSKIGQVNLVIVSNFFEKVYNDAFNLTFVRKEKSNLHTLRLMIVSKGTGTRVKVRDV